MREETYLPRYRTQIVNAILHAFIKKKVCKAKYTL